MRSVLEPLLQPHTLQGCSLCTTPIQIIVKVIDRSLLMRFSENATAALKTIGKMTMEKDIFPTSRNHWEGNSSQGWKRQQPCTSHCGRLEQNRREVRAHLLASQIITN